eukprot:12356699-Heterocapsa_arctica.AAC.1
MALAGSVRLSPWIKPYYRDTLHHVRRAKDLPLLVCLLSVVFQQFGARRSVLTKESIADLIERYDLAALADYDRQAINGRPDCVRHFAAPCQTIIPEVKALEEDPEPFRRKPRFDDNVFIEETIVDFMVDDYRYAISRVRKRPLRPVTRDPNTMYTRDLISVAVARFRAIELANGTGVINDPDDSEQWMGVDKIHPMESRKLPVVWTTD